MKHIPPLLAFAALIVLAAIAPAASVNDTYRAARSALSHGDTATAESLFEEILRSNPNHLGAKMGIKSIRTAAAGENRLEKQVQRIVIESLEFKDATLDSVLEYLRQQAQPQMPGGEPLNFVSTLSPGAAASRKITLSLRRTPLPEVLRYIGELANVQITIDQHAVVISEKSAAKPEPAARPDSDGNVQ